MDEVAEVSDELMERYLEGEEISHEEIVTALKNGVTSGTLFPVTCGVATKNLGINRLLDALVEDLPSPVKRGRLRRSRRRRSSRPRTRRDGRVRLQDARRPVRRAHQPLPRLPGRDHARLAGAQLPRARQGARWASCSCRRARRWSTPTSSAPGDIGAVAKLKETHAGDVLGVEGRGSRDRAAEAAAAR